MKTVNLKDRNTFYASPELIERMKESANYSDPILNFAYTDYGGTFYDKIMIEYFEKNHPDFIVTEDTNWYGKNAFVFGTIAKDFIEANENYLLSFGDTEEYYSMRQSEVEREDFERFLKEIRPDYRIKRGALDKILNEKSGYYNVSTQGVDYSHSALIEWCLSEGIIKKRNL